MKYNLDLESVLDEGGLRKTGIFKKTISSDKPLITVITATLNSELYLEECIQSLQNQEYKNFEHIIIDGGSTDKTLEIVKSFKDQFASFKIYSGPCKGPSANFFSLIGLNSNLKIRLYLLLIIFSC